MPENTDERALRLLALIEDSDPEVRLEAEIALVKLQEGEPG